MKYFEYIAVAIALGGALFNKWNLPGGDILVIIGLGVLAFFYALTGSILNKVQERRGTSMPFSVFSSIVLAIGVLSLLFSQMAWSYSGLLAVISFIALPIVIIINLYQVLQKSENPLNKMAVIRAVILIIALIVF
jgi:hypothetical protein